MSRSYALVRFKKSGNIYFGCYNGTVDIMLPFLCTPEECYDEKFDCYCSITYCQNIRDSGKDWNIPDDCDDLDEVEIYSDYGGGFYWPGVGSEGYKMLESELNPFDYCYEDMLDGAPEWVEEFWAKIGAEE